MSHIDTDVVERGHEGGRHAPPAAQPHAGSPQIGAVNSCSRCRDRNGTRPPCLTSTLMWSNEDTKEDAMLRLLLSLTPARLRSERSIRVRAAVTGTEPARHVSHRH